MRPYQILIVSVMLSTCLALGGCSDSDPPVTGPVIDTAPPIMPTGLKSCTGDCVVKIFWDPNITDADLEGFRVYRMAFDQTWRLTQTPLNETKFVDWAPLGGECLYGVTAVDASGNESGWSMILVNCNKGPINMHRQ
jgi:hypothetical protein